MPHPTRTIHQERISPPPQLQKDDGNAHIGTIDLKKLDLIFLYRHIYIYTERQERN
jgi:hypothetical protein